MLKSTPHRREPSTDKYSVQKGGQCRNCTSNKRVASAELYRMKASALLHRPVLELHIKQKGGHNGSEGVTTDFSIQVDSVHPPPAAGKDARGRAAFPPLHTAD